MVTKFWKCLLLAPAVFILPGWSLFGGSDGPSADVAASYLTNELGNVSNLKLSNCSGDDTHQSCIAAYNRTFGPGRYYEELNMDFQKTPSGWNVTRYRVIKTDIL
ncbi:hypothetical protein RHE_CH01992 [Rhizobium etli CFN 42]|uniref:Uncharacterized protein n=1 Tax=Rhizobium etli (strain ATCC 51251 / DSM 11541 / JCM 21823 / NBRC 15573 / CFN 42) TaxID=347834 RepID=Q2K8Q9_RHIEC|nr:hypothetical protein [Rhizobium etli]ABC90777.1 hypothetical protein RHE_CH01992 [Rhizobium etli CFN 42]